MNISTATDKLIPALIKARGEIEPPVKNREGQARGGKYPYADLGSVLEAVMDPLAANDIALISAPGCEGQAYVLTTRLAHISGQWVEAMYPLPGGVNPQELGAAITYGRRYNVMALLAITSEDDDDDAAAAMPKPGKEYHVPARTAQKPLKESVEKGASNEPPPHPPAPAKPKENPDDTTTEAVTVMIWNKEPLTGEGKNGPWWKIGIKVLFSGHQDGIWLTCWSQERFEFCKARKGQRVLITYSTSVYKGKEQYTLEEVAEVENG